MGVTVRQKTKGKGKPWWVFIAHNGKRTSRKVGDKAAAEAVASQIRAKLQLGEFGFEAEKSVPTFKEYADSWIKTTVPATCKASTVQGYQDLLEMHVNPVFSDLKIVDITRGKVKDFLLSKVADGYAGSTVIHIKNVISGVFNKALDDEAIQANPALNLGKIIPRKSSSEIKPLTKKELKLLLDTVQKHYPKHYCLFLLLARTGMRIGEALGLKWGDIDFNGRFIEIKRSLVGNMKWSERLDKTSKPKNGKTRRVDMSLQLKAALNAHLIESRRKGFALGLGDLPEFVFSNSVGRSIDASTWRRRVFKKALQKAGLRDIRIHDLRHSYATIRISKGDSIEDVSNQLGHYSPKITWDVYYHWRPGKKKSEVDALDDDSMVSDTHYMHPEQVQNSVC